MNVDQKHENVDDAEIRDLRGECQFGSNFLRLEDYKMFDHDHLNLCPNL